MLFLIPIPKTLKNANLLFVSVTTWRSLYDLIEDCDIIEPNSFEFTSNLPYKSPSYILIFALTIAALCYSQLVKVKATQYKSSFTHHTVKSALKTDENYETPQCFQKFLENRLNNAGGRRDLHTE